MNRSNSIKSNMKKPSQTNRMVSQRNMRNSRDMSRNNSMGNFNNKKGPDKNEILITFKKLWLDNTLWTRFFIISAISGTGDLQIVTKKLIKNPTDFSVVLKKFYNEEETKKLEVLMMDHLLIGIKLINTAKSGNITAINGLKEQWYKNANDISEYLFSLNPNWDKKEWNKMFFENLKLTEEQVIKRFGRQYADDIESFEKLELLSEKMANFMAEGILKKSR